MNIIVIKIHMSYVMTFDIWESLYYECLIKNIF